MEPVKYKATWGDVFGFCAFMYVFFFSLYAPLLVLVKVLPIEIAAILFIPCLIIIAYAVGYGHGEDEEKRKNLKEQ